MSLAHTYLAQYEPCVILNYQTFIFVHRHSPDSKLDSVFEKKISFQKLNQVPSCKNFEMELLRGINKTGEQSEYLVNTVSDENEVSTKEPSKPPASKPRFLATLVRNYDRLTD